MTRFKRILVGVLVAVQFCAAPVASALPVMQSEGAMHETHEMHAEACECPCCPEGVDSAAACLAACAIATGITSSFYLPAPAPPSASVSLPVSTAHSRAFDPPLNPPPIA